MNADIKNLVEELKELAAIILDPDGAYTLPLISRKLTQSALLINFLAGDDQNRPETLNFGQGGPEGDRIGFCINEDSYTPFKDGICSKCGSPSNGCSNG
jgi:hypothetical protein